MMKKAIKTASSTIDIIDEDNVQDYIKETKKICSHCGHQNSIKDFFHDKEYFCSSCGQKL